MEADGDFTRCLSALRLAFWLLLQLLPHWFPSESFGGSMSGGNPLAEMPSRNPSRELILGNFVSITLGGFAMNTFRTRPKSSLNAYVIPKNYQHLLAFAFAVHEINKDAKLLPNTTLGYEIYDNAFYSWRACWTTLDLLFLGKGYPLNYDCGRKEKVIAVIGGLTSQTSMQMAHILNVYNIPQVSYGFLDKKSTEKVQFPFIYQMTPGDDLLYIGIVCLLNYFGWNWVGLVISEDDSGETFLQTVKPKLLESHICIAWTQVISTMTEYLAMDVTQAKPVRLTFSMSEINVTLVHGDRQSLEGLRFILDHFEIYERKPQRRVWVTTARWDYTALPAGVKLSTASLNGTLSFAPHTNVVPGFRDFLESVSLFNTRLHFFHQFWCTVFVCSLPLHNLHIRGANNCTGQEKLTGLPGSVFELGMSGHSYGVYNAVYLVAHALHALYSFSAKQKGRRGGDTFDHRNIQPWQLHRFLKTLPFNNNAGEEILLDEKGELATGFDIINFFVSPNESFNKVQVGQLDLRAPGNKQFIINGSAIVWNPRFNQPPSSTCVESCQPGQSMFVQPGQQVCCYDCVRCPEGRISVQRDLEQCKECPEDQYPNQNQDQCFPKNVICLTYGEPFGAVLASASLFFSMGTALVMWAFIRHRDTPIIKANNWSITCTLLSSLLACFLCPFLFIGRPGKVTCLLRQVVFSSVFTIAVACVLAKTITVVLAFMATKPGSRMRTWIGKKLDVSVIIPSFFFLEVLCAVWLTMDPPFPELDMHSQMDAIIFQCSEGSSPMFYIVLGYMGLLALSSFLVAFFARKLPATFNEAKLITFSMLVFCSVWVSFVPTYLSSKGKYVVIVEIFSILASSAGLLACLFLPKLYIVILRPGLNTRKQFTRRKN